MEEEGQAFILSHDPEFAVASMLKWVGSSDPIGWRNTARPSPLKSVEEL